MKKLVIVGSGRLGKGFIGETFYHAGWDITFLDSDENVITRLNEKGYYHVSVHRMECIEEQKVSGYSAFTWDNKQADLAIANADLIMMPLYPEDFQEAFKNMEKGLFHRYKHEPDKQMSIVCLTNKNHLMGVFKKEMRKDKCEDYVTWLDTHVSLSDSIIRRSTDAEDSSSLTIRSTAVLSLLIQKPIFVSVEDVEWMEPIDQLEVLKDIKIFSVNGPHVTSAFAGYYYGYNIWNEAMKHPEVKKLMDNVSNEITNAILKVYPITKQQLNSLSVFPIAKGEMEDTIYRIAKDPIRKLSNNDRLVGIAKIAEQQHLSMEGLSKAIALGYLYDNPADEAAVKVQRCITERGIENTIQKISGIDKNTKLCKNVIKFYNNYKLLQHR